MYENVRIQFDMSPTTFERYRKKALHLIIEYTKSPLSVGELITGSSGKIHKPQNRAPVGRVPSDSIEGQIDMMDFLEVPDSGTGNEKEYTLIDEMKKTETRFTYGGRWDLSAYIRNLVLSQTGKKDVRVDMELKDLNYQVRKIVVNINQIAHRLNSNIGDMRDAEYVVELMKELNARLEKLTEKIEK